MAKTEFLCLFSSVQVSVAFAAAIRLALACKAKSNFFLHCKAPRLEAAQERAKKRNQNIINKKIIKTKKKRF